jgi:hypothetical protein
MHRFPAYFQQVYIKNVTEREAAYWVLSCVQLG